MPSAHPTSSAPLVARVFRGPIAESLHAIYVTETGCDGALVACAGDSSFVTTLRSSGKPMQAIPALTLPGAADLDLTDEELAICCASHPGEPRHAALAASVLALSGFLPDNLVCGSAGNPPSPLRHGCSGNHAAVLLAAKLLGAPLNGYEKPDHPAQCAIREIICEMSGGEAPLLAIDGCGIATFGISLTGMARAFGRLTQSGAPWERIPRAMGAHPDLVGSPSWIDVLLMEVTQGRLIAKTGAEGLLCVGAGGRGVAVKVLDGSTRALGAATIAWLLRSGWISEREASDERLAELRRPRLFDPSGNAVGEITIVEDAVAEP